MTVETELSEGAFATQEEAEADLADSAAQPDLTDPAEFAKHAPNIAEAAAAQDLAPQAVGAWRPQRRSAMRQNTKSGLRIARRP
jgi:hypothetical protein